MAELQIIGSHNRLSPLWIMLRYSYAGDEKHTSEWRRWRYDFGAAEWSGATEIPPEDWDDPVWRKKVHDDLLASMVPV